MLLCDTVKIRIIRFCKFRIIRYLVNGFSLTIP
nr:MAG TPA: hypothetical protein [Caudoviricetes sp.]